MPTYVVTGATGAFGRHAIAALLARGVAPADVVAVVRTPAKADDLAALGVQVREGDYDRPETLAAAFAGVSHLLFVSGSQIGSRVPQHQAVVDAAVAAGVGRVAYTSILHADTTTNPLAPEHVATEAMLASSGLAHSLLRNGWYVELYAGQVGRYVAQGEIVGAAQDGRIAAAPREQYAQAAVAALLGDEGARVVHELGGDAFTLTDLAAAVAAAAGEPVVYRDITVDELAAGLEAAGLPAPAARMFAEVDGSIAAGALDTTSDELARLLGHAPTPVAEVVAREVNPV
ncbi:NAD(P)H-binding protein [Cellulomonas composti]|uniref:NAD(P)-dependent oxidoreductase n=1 Tax=Cellulomonas composti TaxID=266130 RepID=A0A511J9E8_9CELL|nr:NAD(P)H-binding protein [Cellulomonas composti]GEL94621.1 NAD(P)-dependent oxidoreductase [Cellulomonas composti]